MKTTTPRDRAEVLRMTSQLFYLRYSNRFSAQAACLLWASAVGEILKGMGIKSAIQAGTAHFRINHPDRDNDEGQPNAFSYTYHENEAMGHLFKGEFPEMHCWLYIPETEEIVDTTTGFQPAQMKKMIGREWDAEILPPEHLWITVQELMDDPLSRFTYIADKGACLIAMAKLVSFHHHVLHEKHWLLP